MPMHPQGGGAGDRRPSSPSLGMVVLESKLRAAPIRRDWVQRQVLHDRLVDAAGRKVVLVSAPIGYGKTNLLDRWSSDPREARPFAWVTLDASDNEPLRFWTYLVEAIRQVQRAFGGNLIDLLERGSESLLGAVVPQLIDELALLPRRIVIVLDDFSQLSNPACLESIDEFVDSLPSTTQLVISTRSDPALPSLQRTGERSEMLEIRVRDLRFTIEEAGSLFKQTADIELELRDIERIVERTEGWPAGLYLAALSLQDRDDPEAFIRDFAGDSRHVADYLTTEILSRLPERVRRFLVRTSILERFNSSLSDAVVGEEGSAALLEDLERKNLFLVPLDDQRDWFRYHRLFQELLQRDLSASDRLLVPELHRRASQWHRSWGFLDDAIKHANAANDLETCRDLISGNWLAYCNAGRLTIVRSWIESLGEERVTTDPVLSLTAAWIGGLSGHLHEVEKWLKLAGEGSFPGPLPDETSSLASGIALVRASFGHEGVGKALIAARVALEFESRRDAKWRPAAQTALGFYLFLSGERELATAQLEEVAEGKPRGGAFEVIFALSQLSIIASETGRRIDAERLARKAIAIGDEYRFSDAPQASVAYAGLGRALVAADDLRGGSRELERALALRRRSDLVAPWPTLQLLLALAPVRATLGDREGTALLMQEAHAIVDRYRDAGVLGAELEELERSIAAAEAENRTNWKVTDRSRALSTALASYLTNSARDW